MKPPPKSVPRETGVSLDWLVPLLAVAMVFVMLVPLPTFLLDLLLSTSITASVLVLLVAMYITRPVQFSVFPSLPPAPHAVPAFAESGQQQAHPAPWQ